MSRGPLPTDSRAAWRLIVDGDAAGAWNMAVDETLLARHAAADDRDGGARPPTLRLYGWSPAALTLGRHQPADGAHDPGWLRREAVDLVRRPSGGRAVLHEGERTYALIANAERPPLDGSIIETYGRIAAGLVRALAAIGVTARANERPAVGARGPRLGHPSCFVEAGRSEILAADGRKLVGSAQTRRGRAFLQHGSIPIARDPRRVAAAIGTSDLGAFTDLATVLGRAPSREALDTAIVEGIAREFGVSFEVGALDERERRLAHRLRRWRYDSVRWTLEGRVGETERRVGPSLHWTDRDEP